MSGLSTDRRICWSGKYLFSRVQGLGYAPGLSGESEIIGLVVKLPKYLENANVF